MLRPPPLHRRLKLPQLRPLILVLPLLLYQQQHLLLDRPSRRLRRLLLDRSLNLPLPLDRSLNLPLNLPLMRPLIRRLLQVPLHPLPQQPLQVLIQPLPRRLSQPRPPILPLPPLRPRQLPLFQPRPLPFHRPRHRSPNPPFHRPRQLPPNPSFHRPRRRPPILPLRPPLNRPRPILPFHRPRHQLLARPTPGQPLRPLRPPSRPLLPPQNQSLPLTRPLKPGQHLPLAQSHQLYRLRWPNRRPPLRFRPRPLFCRLQRSRQSHRQHRRHRLHRLLHTRLPRPVQRLDRNGARPPRRSLLRPRLAIRHKRYCDTYFSFIYYLSIDGHRTLGGGGSLGLGLDPSGGVHLRCEAPQGPRSRRSTAAR